MMSSAMRCLAPAIALVSATRSAMLPILRAGTTQRGFPPARLLPSSFHTHRPLAAKPLPPRIKIDEADIEENFLKGSGPGGQKINKTSSAVQLLHRPTGLVVKCQATRSRIQNRKTARRLLGERIEELMLGEDARTAVKAREAARKKASKAKKAKRKYRLLDEEKDAAAGREEGAEIAGGRVAGVSEEGGAVQVDTVPVSEGIDADKARRGGSRM